MNYRHHPVAYTTCLVLAVGFCSTTTARSQITIDRSVLESFVGRTEMAVLFEATSVAGVEALVAASGENQSWNLTSFSFAAIDTTTLTFLDSGAGLPGAETPEFAGSNFAQIESFGSETGAALDSVGYVFGALTDNAWTIFGVAARFENAQSMMPDTIVAVFEPPTREFVFPLTFGAAWRDSTTIRIDSLLSASLITESTVDGWGTLTTDDGVRDALRLFEMEVESLPPFFSDTSYAIIFQAADGSVAEIELDENMTPVGLFFETLETVSTSVARGPRAKTWTLLPVYPNPVAAHAVVPFSLGTSGDVRLQIYDVLGRSVATLIDGTLAAGRHDAVWSPADIANGLYVVRLSSGGLVQTRTLTLRR